MGAPRTPRPEAASLRVLLQTCDGNASAVARLMGVETRTVQRWVAELRSAGEDTPEHWGESDEQADKRARQALRRRLVAIAGNRLAAGLAEPDCPVELALEALRSLRLLEEPIEEPEQPAPVVFDRAQIEQALVLAVQQS